jgi:hypothetical protein
MFPDWKNSSLMEIVEWKMKSLEFRIFSLQFVTHVEREDTSATEGAETLHFLRLLCFDAIPASSFLCAHP